jgi:ABC-type nitrate/sulfonate/bicarbonate transport system ATPase subunit
MFINAEKMSFGYTPEKGILNSISFQLRRTDTLSIVGASGSGKSTLLRIISGILPNAKDNRLSGKTSINEQTPDEYRRSGKLAFMFQESTLMPNLTVKENIAFPLKMRGIQDDERVLNLLETVGLVEYASYLPKQLSGGMKTRVALARSFATGPELLLLDEPFSALDIAWKSKLYMELQKLLRRYNTTVVLVTHDVQEALLLANHIIVLGKRGTILHEDTITTELSIPERIFDISNFIKSRTYQDHFVPIQKWIMDDGVREITGRSEVDGVLNRIGLVAGNSNEEWDSYRNDLLSLRKYTNDPAVNSILVDAFRKAKSVDFRYELMWEITNYKALSESIQAEVFEFYLANLPYFSAKSAQFYQVGSERLFDTLIGTKINGDRVKFPKEKLWIYLCDMFHSSEPDRVLTYLDDVAEGKVEQLDYAFAKTVAQKIKRRIKDETANTVHLA